jgi:hypothetical protein
MKKEKEVKVIHFYGCYFIANERLNEYWMLDIPNNKLRPIDSDCYNIIELLSDIKGELKNI